MDEFTIEIPQDALDDLHHRLDSARWPDQLKAGWSYGVELGRLRELAEYWRTAYRWRAFEERLNELPQYRTEIDGQLVHFFHLRSAAPDAIPLLLTHGWPGSGADFLQVAEQLTDFHLVIPSIPGFGFSGPTTATGWDVDRIAAAWTTLMEELGYSRYGVHACPRLIGSD
ncbi:epoxide hydrolase [Kribbella sp. NPDC006257]|uniref:epoxide hydrolase family protein n=1 Tax=Kribbella sp. NPDC006257 TaxID=3156738 RepID=UPI0033B3B3D1